MIFYGVNIFVLIILTLVFVMVSRRKFDEMLPVSVFVIILFLYIFSLFAQIQEGLFLLYGFVVLFFALAIYFGIKKNLWKEVVRNLFTPGFCMFLFLVLFIALVTRGRLLGKWDEFTNWGLQLKNLYIFHGLANVEGVTTLGTGYPPATTVFEYFFSGLRRTLVEEDMFRGMAIFTVSLILPIFRKITWKRWYFVVFALPLFYLLPSIFAKDMEYMNTLYVDALLGLVMAYTLYAYFSNKVSRFSLLSTALGLSVLSLVKSTGFPLAMVVIVVIGVDLIFFKRKEIKIFLGEKYNRLFLIGAIALTFFGKISWWVFVRMMELKEVWSYVEVSSEGGGEIFNEIRLQIINNFIRGFFSLEKGSVYGLSAFGWIFVFAILFLLIALILKQRKKIKRAAVAFVLLILGYLGYVFSLMFMYLFLFIEYEGLNLASFSRYIDTYILALLIFMIAILFHLLLDIAPQRGITCVLCLIAIMALVLPYPYILDNSINAKENIEKVRKKREKFSYSETFVDWMDVENTRIYFICQKSRGLEYAISYYNATPIRLGYDFYMGWSLGKPYYEGDIWTLDFSLKEWADILKESYTHVYVYKIDEQFITRYERLFADSIENDTVYEVVKSAEGVLLRKSP